MAEDLENSLSDGAAISSISSSSYNALSYFITAFYKGEERVAIHHDHLKSCWEMLKNFSKTYNDSQFLKEIMDNIKIDGKRQLPDEIYKDIYEADPAEHN